ncbi:hypothetical protein SNN62_002281 [Cronobacter sakazakii]|nr:hypothetical protein [Cronobacter sakazakii]
MDKSREQFEAAIKQKFGDLIDQRVCKNGDGEYMAWDMQVAWWAWQASRAAVEIELPDVCAWNLCELLDKKYVVKAITDAGLKVKGE